MTPRDVDELSDAEYAAFQRYASQEIKARNRAARRKS